jgi:hypothetical protein
MDKGQLITNLNNAVRLVYLTYDYAANSDVIDKQRVEMLEYEIGEHCSIIINSLKKPINLTPPSYSPVIPVIQPTQQPTAPAYTNQALEDPSWYKNLQPREVGDEEVASMGRSDT